MHKALTNMVRKSFRLMGMDVHRLTASNNASLQLLRGLDYFTIDTVLDIRQTPGSLLRDFAQWVIVIESLALSFCPMPIKNCLPEYC